MKSSFLTENNWVANQYRDSSNLDARIALHRRFSVNPQGWHHWIFEELHLPMRGRVLELGCGTGELWDANQNRLPGGTSFFLSDRSAGMVSRARARLSGIDRTLFAVIDAQAIPMPDRAFDVVIANHMLYHVPDKDMALQEIKRVLAPEGQFYASTVGFTHMRELDELIARFDDPMTGSSHLPGPDFVLENGAAYLSRHFPRVTQRRYPDQLRITEVEPVVAYALSGSRQRCLTGEGLARFRERVQGEIDAQGAFTITKDSGLFRCAG